MAVVLLNPNRATLPAYVGAASIVPAGDAVRMVFAYCAARRDALQFADAARAHEFLRLAGQMHARDVQAMRVSEAESEGQA